MAKTLDEILKAGRADPAALRELQEQAKKAGLTKKVIHIELDMITGNLKSQCTPMDHVMHLGMLEFYKATVLGNMLNKAISKPDAPDREHAPEPASAEAAAVTGPALPGEGNMAGDSASAEEAKNHDHIPAPAKTEGGAPSA